MQDCNNNNIAITDWSIDVRQGAQTISLLITLPNDQMVKMSCWQYTEYMLLIYFSLSTNARSSYTHSDQGPEDGVAHPPNTIYLCDGVCCYCPLFSLWVSDIQRLHLKALLMCDESALFTRVIHMYSWCVVHLHREVCYVYLFILLMKDILFCHQSNWLITN